MDSAPKGISSSRRLIKETEDQLPPRSFLKEEILSHISENVTIHTAVSQSVVITTEDKLRLHLRGYHDSLKATLDWIGPTGILATLVTTLYIADFTKAFLGVKPATWQAVFLLGAGISALFAAKSIIKSLKSRKERDIDSLINKIKISKIDEAEYAVEPGKGKDYE